MMPRRKVYGQRRTVDALKPRRRTFSRLCGLKRIAKEEIHGWFTQGFDTVDLQGAKELLQVVSHEGEREGPAGVAKSVGSCVGSRR